ncbi:MAG: TM1266 family iron-only hydrogenase system putative regulator [Verrucomicrobiota bacterium]
MNTRIGVIAILVEKREESVPRVNELLTEFGELIIGRIGVPYREREVNIISLIVEGTTDQLSTLTGKLGMLPGVQTKSLLLTK